MTTQSLTVKPKLTYQQRMNKMKAHDRLRLKVKAAIDRFGPYVVEIKSWKNAREELSTAATKAQTMLEELLDELDGLPSDFAPVVEKTKAASKPGANIAIGAQVTLRTKHAGSYDGIIAEKDALAPFQVIAIRKSRIVCQTASGERFLLPRGHVKPVSAEVAA